MAEHWVIPAEALEEHHGAAITYDDVLDFALGLDRVRPARRDDQPARPGLTAAPRLTPAAVPAAPRLAPPTAR